MSVEFVALAGCTVGMAYAMSRRNQIGVLVLAALYAALVGWIVLTDLALLMPALGIAIALALAALAMMLCRDVADNVGMCRKNSQKETSNHETL